MEEHRVTALRMYVQKVEINKVLKVLEFQVRELQQDKLKKEENGENWLMAKKPYGGYNCGSCERQLVDLKENVKVVYNNKMPLRETEKIYRVANGYSNMLKHINLQSAADLVPTANMNQTMAENFDLRVLRKKAHKSESVEKVQKERTTKYFENVVMLNKSAEQSSFNEDPKM